jgi:hypothetical protein
MMRAGTLVVALGTGLLPGSAEGAGAEREAACADAGPASAALAAGQADPAPGATRIRLRTRYEGEVEYVRHEGLWVRAAAEADRRAEHFFRDFEADSPAIRRLLLDAGAPARPAVGEREAWEQIARVWAFLGARARLARPGEPPVSSQRGRWPSIADYAAAYAARGVIPWAACFSKAHVLATLLGRTLASRDRVAIAEAHHTSRGAPATATHVYVAVRVASRWFYVDPTAVRSERFPPFDARRSIGAPGLSTVDYEHPFATIPVPGSSLSRVPYLPG